MKYNETAVNIMLVYQSITDNTCQQCSNVSTDIFNKIWLIDWSIDWFGNIVFVNQSILNTTCQQCTYVSTNIFNNRLCTKVIDW